MQHRMSDLCAEITLDHLTAEVDVWHRLIGDLREVVALSTSKAALDCCLGGLYVQGLMLTRHLFETWQRIAYTFLKPHTANDWLSPTGATPTPPNRGTFHRELVKSPMARHRRWAPGVEKTISDLDLLAHPSYRTLTAHDTPLEGFIAIGGRYSGDTARNLIRHACIAQMLILQEHRYNNAPYT